MEVVFVSSDRSEDQQMQYMREDHGEEQGCRIKKVAGNSIFFGQSGCESA